MRDVCRAEHIAVGSEILLGQIANGHARTVSLALAAQGFHLYHHSAVGDNLQRLKQEFSDAENRSNVVIVTGGLGPTDDDLTKEALAEFLNRPLAESQEAVLHLAAYFANRRHPMPEENRKQALYIAGGSILPNPNGTAPGQYVEARGVHYFLLPGPPLEMVPMLSDYVLPRLRSLFGGNQVLVSRVLHFCGIGESAVDEQIRDLTAQINPTVAPLAGEGEMLLRITATGETREAALGLVAPVEETLREKFVHYIYGIDDETLPMAVGRALKALGSTVATAESCTGGLISTMLTSIPGSSNYVTGSVVAYQNAIKEGILGVSSDTLNKFGAVSEQTAREMAEGVKKLMHSTYGVSVTGIAGPEGGTPEKPVGLVYGTVAGPNGSEVIKMQFRGSREQIRIRAAKYLLWKLWSQLRDVESRQDQSHLGEVSGN